MESCLAVLIVRKFGDFVERTADPPDSATEMEQMLANLNKGLSFGAHHALPLPRKVIQEAFETLLPKERNPDRIEWLKVGLVMVRNDEAGYGECIVPLERALASLLAHFPDYSDPSDSFTTQDVARAIQTYLGGHR